MTKQINNGGPAFPVPTYVELEDSLNQPNRGSITSVSGMSLRDYFAAKALQGWAGLYGASSSYEESAHAAYKYADAMIKARK